tara:strand:- start:169 stop:1065 length:897 start_codon:yes stop_codon:yes gene_type:complete
LRPARPDGKPIAAYAEQGEPIANKQLFSWDRVQSSELIRADTRRPTKIALQATPGEQRFSWDALNVTNATTCGGVKCYFQGEREGEGWLVCWRHSPLVQQSKAWAFAEKLRVDFGVDHLLRGAPFLATLPYKQAKHLNAKINISLDRRKNPPYRFPRKDGARQIYAAGSYPVQAVRSCSWPECMVMKCYNSPSVLTAQAIEGFVANAPNKTNLRLGLQQNFAQVTAMIKAHPCLKSDFQVYLRNDGAVLNIDLDRCKRNKSGSVSLSDTDKSRLENKTITLTTDPLKLTCRGSNVRLM